MIDAPIHDNWPGFAGPPFKCVDVDAKYWTAGEDQPRPRPWLSARRLTEIKKLKVAIMKSA